MIDIFKDVFLDSLVDTIKLLPFLFITYLIMEYIEHKMKEHSKQTIKKSGKLGPLVGAVVGVIPQCGFSASATSLYSARVITLGSLIAVYLSTSDEMLPIFISESVPFMVILKILLIKFLIGLFFGFIIDMIRNLFFKNYKKKITKEKLHNTNEKEIEFKICETCKKENCKCNENGILKSAVKHTISITIYIFIITFIITALVEFVGEENISNFVGEHTIIGPAICSLIGLIPNCAASVIITNLYIQNIISSGALIAGLLTGAGVGLIVLFKTNKSIKENLTIIAILYAIGVISGIFIQLMNFSPLLTN